MRNESLRKSLHILIGLFILALLQLNLLNIFVLIGMLLVAVIIYMLSRFKIPVIIKFLEAVDKGEKIYGKGAVTYMVGVIGSYVFFHQYPAILSASIIILAFGDGFAGIFGRNLGKTKLPFNKNKTLEGSFAGLFFSFLGALIFVPIIPALIVSVIMAVLESLPLKTKNFNPDDNLYIPLLAAVILWVLV